MSNTKVVKQYKFLVFSFLQSFYSFGYKFSLELKKEHSKLIENCFSQKISAEECTKMVISEEAKKYKQQEVNHD